MARRGELPSASGRERNAAVVAAAQGRRSFGAALVGLALAPIGCVTKPVLQLHSARVESASPMGVGVVLLMKVNNDNVFDVQVRNVRASVLIAGRYRLPPIYYNPARWMPAGGTVLVPVPVVVPWPMVGPLLATTAGAATIHYHVSGLADVTAVKALGFESNDYELDESGSISRAALVMAASRGVFTPTPY
jgi:hypothetical protein